MGANMARRLMRAGHSVVVYDRSPEAVATLAGEGAIGAASLDAYVGLCERPRTICLMVPAAAVTAAIAELRPLLAADDVIVDGGNSHYQDDIARAASLSADGLHYIDMGTSGGVWGLERGYCLMIGGEADVVHRLDPMFRALAPGPGQIERTAGRDTLGGTAEQGYLHCGPAGAGHFVKMVHNGIEYGLMQAYAEGFDILRNAGGEQLPAGQRYDLDLADVAEVWRHGSVVGSWLLDLTASALAEDSKLSQFSGFVQDSGEGRWTIEAAMEEAVPVEVLASALFARFRSRQDHTFAEKVQSAMRYKFGGHVERPAGG